MADDPTNQTEDPATPMLEVFVAMHEMFLSAMKAGFTEPQALQIIISMMATFSANANSDDDD